MLRVTQQVSAQGAKRYYAGADYYSQGQEIVGSWGGAGARLLGLQGVVDKDAFDRLCDNIDPVSGKPLTVRTRSKRSVGYDFTFSVPKSVSLLYAMSGDKAMLDAFRSAVAETMRDIEAEMQTRVRKGGKDCDRTTGNMAWAEFIHTTSRPVDGVPDPQLHAHAFVFNSTWDNHEHRWKAGQFRGLKRDAPYFQAAFRARLANKLQDLGFAVERKRDDFEIAGVPASVIKKFSRRTDLIENIAAERGITDPDRKGELGAATREKKSHALSWDQLRAVWESRMSDEEKDAAAAAYGRDVPVARSSNDEKTAVDFAIDHCFVRDAVVSERRLETEALKRGLGTVTVAGIKRELATRPLIRGEHDGRRMATTPEMLADENRLVSIAREGRGRFRPLGDSERPFVRDWLNGEQRAAIRHVLGSYDLVTIIRGAAGTGKTTLEQELGEALAEAGRPVVALAPTATASRGVLRDDAGFTAADTVARFLADREMQKSAHGGVVLVDEASLLGMTDMLRLFDVAVRVEARLVLVGDRKQHRAVAAGEPLRLLEEKAGLPVAEVTNILRQSGDYKKAAKALSEGNTELGLAILDKLGWVKEVADAERYHALAAAYLAAIAEKKRNGEYKSALVVSPTHSEAARITESIRAALKAKGLLSEERAVAVWRPAHLTDAQKRDATNYSAGDMMQFHRHAAARKSGSRLVVGEGTTLPLAHAGRFEVYRPAQLMLAAGDRIRITANGWSKDGKHRLDNGSLFNVRGFTKRGDIVLDGGWVISKDWGHFTAGYVVTSHAAQGKTVDKVFIGQSAESFPASNRRQFYVSASRAREQAMVFTHSKADLLNSVQRDDQPLSATEFVAAMKNQAPPRSRLQKHLAFMRRLGNFTETHPHRTPPLQREPAYVR